MILHIPHSSCVIPYNLRDQIVLSDKELLAEILLMTDAFTDELFALPEATILRFPISRLLVDVERFSDDTKEPMSSVGMGMIYNRTAYGNELKRELQPHERKVLEQYYTTHHERLFEEVNKELESFGQALIADCHSFPSIPLPCDMNKSIPRPDFCIGTDSFHTPDSLIRIADQKIKDMGYTSGLNQPYAGSIVPMAFYHKDRRVASIMIEVNRKLYMDEMTGVKKDTFESTQNNIQTILSSFKEFQHI
ncbi:MAG: N-formylglutamate amidohydrolase [Pseudomonadota bacterium]